MTLRGLITKTNLILFATTLAAALILRAQLDAPTPRHDDQRATGEQAVLARQQPPPSPARSISFYREIATRPLFSQSRKPPAPKVATPAPATPRVPKIEIELLGVVFTPGSKLAVIKDLKSGQPKSVREGEVYKGWTVSLVEAHQVRLTYADQSKIYRIFHSSAGQNKKTPSSQTPRLKDTRSPIDVRRQNSPEKPLNDQP